MSWQLSLLLVILVVALNLLASSSAEEPAQLANNSDNLGIVILDKDSFQEKITANRYLFVLFHAPWCGNCRALYPEYVKLAVQLRGEGSEIKLGEVDITTDGDLQEQLGVKGVPDLIFYREGQPIHYKGGGVSSEEIISWLKKKTSPPAVPVNSVKQVEELNRGYPILTLGFFKDEESFECRAYLEAADSVDDPSLGFGVTSDSQLFSGYNITGDSAVIVLKPFDGGRDDFREGYSRENIEHFVLTNRIPLVVEYSKQAMKLIHTSPIKKHYFFYVKKDDEWTDGLRAELENAARQFKGQVIFVLYEVVGSQDDLKMLNAHGVDQDHLPMAKFMSSRIEDGFVEDTAIYRPPECQSRDPVYFTAEYHSNFIADAMEGKVKDIRDSSGTMILNKHNFQDAIDSNQFIMVEFYAPWCGLCKKLAVYYSRATKKLIEERSDVKLAKVDATVEVELADRYAVVGYPTIKFFKSGGSPIDYVGEYTSDDIIGWLEKKTSPAARKVDSVEEVEQLRGEHQVAVVGFFKDPGGVETQAYLEAASQVDNFHIQLAIATSAHVFSAYGIKEEPAIVVFQQFDEGRSDFSGNFSSSGDIKHFIIWNSFPLIATYSNKFSLELQRYTEIDSFYYLLVDGGTSTDSGNGGEKLEKLKKDLTEAARDLKGEVAFLVADWEDEEVRRSFSDLTDNSDLPLSYLFTGMQSRQRLKYRSPASINFTNSQAHKEFIRNALAGNIKSHDEL